MVDSRFFCDLRLTWAHGWLVQCYNSLQTMAWNTFGALLTVMTSKYFLMTAVSTVCSHVEGKADTCGEISLIIHVSQFFVCCLHFIFENVNMMTKVIHLHLNDSRMPAKNCSCSKVESCTSPVE